MDNDQCEKTRKRVKRPMTSGQFPRVTAADDPLQTSELVILPTTMAIPMPTLIYPVRLSEQTSTLKQRPKSPPVIYRIPDQSYGLCKHTTGILADQGGMMYLVTDTPKVDRSKERPRHVAYKGARPMHQTTLTMHATEKNDYLTTSEKFHGGKTDLAPVEKQGPYLSQNISQFELSHIPNDLSPAQLNERSWTTHYDSEFPAKGSDETPSRLHFPSFLNKMNMNQGSGVRTVMIPPKGDQRVVGKFWTQYNRVHNRLGAALGPGVPRERAIRSAHHPLTGDRLGAATKEDNRRVSGNRVLYHQYGRRGAERTFMF